MKKVGVIGANGMLGDVLSEYFRNKAYNVESITRREFNIAEENIKNLDSVVKSLDFVVNCVGIIKPRIAETPIEEVLKVNSIFPMNLARLCNRYEKPCFHVTTDCVYSGKKGKYTELDYFDAEDVYGLSKNAGDMTDCMVIRTSLIGEERNTLRSLLSWVKSQKGKTINGYTNHYWNGVTTLYFAEIIETILKKDLYAKGIYHIFSKEIVSKFELIEMINKIYSLGITVNKFKAPESCDRSLSSEKELCNKIVRKSLRIQIEEMKTFFENYVK
ncbi:SDR family oxidoreductase [Chloroflexota bacterium]